jgi:hypothetical protein
MTSISILDIISLALGMARQTRWLHWASVLQMLLQQFVPVVEQELMPVVESNPG